LTAAAGQLSLHDESASAYAADQNRGDARTGEQLARDHSPAHSAEDGCRASQFFHPPSVSASDDLRLLKIASPLLGSRSTFSWIRLTLLDGLLPIQRTGQMRTPSHEARYKMDTSTTESKPRAKDEQKLQTVARDLRKTPPRSPRQRLGGVVIAARMLDKARADLLGIHGEYNFYPCGLGAYFWKFTGLDPVKFREFAGTGASDEEMDRWIREHATQKDAQAVIRWNNEMVGLRLCDLSEETQEFLAEYIPKFCKPESKVKFFFDVYDVEEGVL
jgi:hypothetical protein